MEKSLFFCVSLFVGVLICVQSAVIMENKTQDPKELPDSALSNKAILQTTFLTKFISGFMASLYVIIISELGDKTFFIAAILSIHNPRLTVYAGAMFALITMTVLSALLGYATEILPRLYTFYASGILFLIFGLKMIKDAYAISPGDTKKEYADVENELSNSNSNGQQKNCQYIRSILHRLLSPIFAEAFLMTFLAEWGDRSQLTTIVLATRENVFGVIIGGVIGHGLCTGLAVIAGRIVAQKIPVKWLTLIGGLTFIIFGLITLTGNPNVK